MTYEEAVERNKRFNRAPMKDRHYYRFVGYSDGSGCPGGYVIGYYSDEQYEHIVKCGLRLRRLD